MPLLVKLPLICTAIAIAVCGCASAPPRASIEGCARARLARAFADANPAEVAGCYVAVDGVTVELTTIEEAAPYADEPRRFVLRVPSGDGHWELLGAGLVRLRLPLRDGARISAATSEACLERVSEGLHGVSYAVTDSAPYVGPPASLRLVKAPCPPSVHLK